MSLAGLSQTLCLHVCFAQNSFLYIDFFLQTNTYPAQAPMTIKDNSAKVQLIKPMDLLGLFIAWVRGYLQE